MPAHTLVSPRRSRSGPLSFGEAALAAGVWTALGSADMLIRAEALPALDVATGGVIACLIRDGDTREAADWLARARRHGSAVLLCREFDAGARPAAGNPAAARMVDGQDAEAVLAAVRGRLQLVRAQGARMIDVCTGDADPVAILVARMYADHQFDGNALRAVDADATAQVERTIHGRDERRGPTGA
jgi:hypothetical protein